MIKLGKGHLPEKILKCTLTETLQSNSPTMIILVTGVCEITVGTLCLGQMELQTQV